MGALKKVYLMSTDTATAVIPEIWMDFSGGYHVEITWSEIAECFEWGMYERDSDGDPEPDCLDSGVSPSALDVVRHFVSTEGERFRTWLEKAAVDMALEIDRQVYGC